MRRFTEHLDAQRTPGWFAARCGRATGSRAGDVLATIKSGEAAARRDYRMQLVVERLTGQPAEDGYVNATMQRGTDLEPKARHAYELATGCFVQDSGFLAHDDLLAGCSLDGHIDDFTGILEAKCPKSATHYRYLKTGGLPVEHQAQVIHNLFITDAQWCDFASFDDRFPPELQLFHVRVWRDEKAIAEYADKLLTFLDEVDRDVAVMKTLANLKEALA